MALTIPKAIIDRDLPALEKAGYVCTSKSTTVYNCIAWAASDVLNWWWPDALGQYFWPEGVPREETVDAFGAAFGTIGYEPCDNSELEDGIEKIALYAVREQGMGFEPTVLF